MPRLRFPFGYSSKAKATKQAKATVVPAKPQDAEVLTFSIGASGDEGGDILGDSTEWEIEVSKDEVGRKEEEIRTLKEKIAAMEKLGEDLKTQLDRSQEETQTLRDQLQSQARKMEQLTTRHLHTVNLLGTHTSDVTSGQVSLAKTRSLSEAEIIAMVEELNAEMLQVAAFIADSFLFEQHSEGDEVGPEVREACRRTSGLLGHRIIGLLRSTPLDDDPLLLEVAIQSSIASCCRWITKAWFVNNLLYERFLAETYGGVREAGPCIFL